MKFIAVIRYWWDGEENSTRTRNLAHSSESLKDLCEYLKANSIDIEQRIYDFSPEPMIENAIHFSYPLRRYKLAEKTNLILKDCKEYDYIFLVDTDCFFAKSEYPIVLKHIKNLQKGEFLLFDLRKLSKQVTNEYLESKDESILEGSDYSYAYSGPKEKGPLYRRLGGLGGVFIAPIDILLKYGGYNEKIEKWGGEDGELTDRIWRNHGNQFLIPIRDTAPYHLEHFVDSENPYY